MHNLKFATPQCHTDGQRRGNEISSGSIVSTAQNQMRQIYERMSSVLRNAGTKIYSSLCNVDKASYTFLHVTLYHALSREKVYEVYLTNQHFPSNGMQS